MKVLKDRPQNRETTLGEIKRTITNQRRRAKKNRKGNKRSGRKTSQGNASLDFDLNHEA